MICSLSSGLRHELVKAFRTRRNAILLSGALVKALTFHPLGVGPLEEMAYRMNRMIGAYRMEYFESVLRPGQLAIGNRLL